MRRFSLLIILCLGLLPLISLGESFPPFPMALWGNATVNSSPAPAGSLVRAYGDGILVGQIIVLETGIYGYTDSMKQKLLIGNASGSITFSIQHTSLNSGAEITGADSEPFVSGSTVNKNLSFTFTVPSPPPSGNGGNNPSGGGGSSPSNNTTSTVTSTTSQADSNNDGKTDILDFNMLMVNWGKSGENNPADFNKDGKVDIFDFNLLMVNWGK